MVIHAEHELSIEGRAPLRLRMRNDGDSLTSFDRKSLTILSIGDQPSSAEREVLMALIELPRHKFIGSIICSQDEHCEGDSILNHSYCFMSMYELKKIGYH